MTRRDYIAFAQLLRRVRAQSGSIGWEKLEQELINVFRMNNYQFNETAFRAAVRADSDYPVIVNRYINRPEQLESN